MAKINKRTRGVREPITEENCPICRKLRKREKKRKIARQNGHKTPRDKNPQVDEELYRRWREHIGWDGETPQVFTSIDEYIAYMDDMFRFVDSFNKEQDERIKAKKRREKEKKLERKARKSKQ